MYMEQNEAAVGVTYSGDAREMMNINPHLHYVVPSEGSNIWFDNMVIPKAARNKKAAYEFINFMLDPKTRLKMLNTLDTRHQIKRLKKNYPRKLPMIKLSILLKQR